MITNIRTATFMPGRAYDALAWANEIAAVFSRVTGKQLRVGGTIGGNVNEICWISQWDSLTHFEEAFPRVYSDAEYMRLLKRAEVLLVPGSVRDQIYRTT